MQDAEELAVDALLAAAAEGVAVGGALLAADDVLCDNNNCTIIPSGDLATAANRAALRRSSRSKTPTPKGRASAGTRVEKLTKKGTGKGKTTGCSGAICLHRS